MICYYNLVSSPRFPLILEFALFKEYFLSSLRCVSDWNLCTTNNSIQQNILLRNSIF